MSIGKWLKKQSAYLALAMANVEKNALGQNKTELDANVAQERRHQQGTLMDALVRGEVTQEVENLRWRMYKMISESEQYGNKLIGYDSKGKPIFKQVKLDKTSGLNKIKLDEFDSYELEMVVDNSPITNGTEGVLEKASTNEEGKIVIKAEDLGMVKNELPISIHREIVPRFMLENFTQKLLVRKINETDRLLEFYITKYPDEFNRTSHLFISEVKKLIENSRNSTVLEIKEVNFITYKTIGKDDFMEYEYKIKSFDKIVEFNGYYIIKFIGEVTIDGKYILEKYKVTELEEKYAKKEKRKKK